MTLDGKLRIVALTTCTAAVFLVAMVAFGILWLKTPSAISIPQEVSVEASGFPSAESCKPCHAQIYEQWSQSFHARSFHEPTFRAMLTIFSYNTRGANPEVWGENYEFCFHCHAPETKVRHNSGELARQVLAGEPISSEGVTCTVCHSIEWVTNTPDPNVPVSFDVGLTPPYHNVKRTDLFQQSELCSSCHDYNNPYSVSPHDVYKSNPGLTGVPCCTVNREWENTSYAKNGVTCQSCHMREEMEVVQKSGTERALDDLYSLTGLARYRDDAGSVDHSFPGGRSEDMLKRAVLMSIEAEPAGTEIRATVRLENRTGHTIPNG